MQHVRNRSVREAVYRGYLMRASEFSSAVDGSDGLNNTPIIERLLEIRAETSKLLGYKNFGELSLSTKMAGSIPEVMDMITNLRSASIAAATKDLSEVEDHAINVCGFKPTSSKRIANGECALELWDIAFYTERLREAKYGYKEEELKVYFALDNVLPGLFTLAQKLFGIVIESVPTTVNPGVTAMVGNESVVEVWHKDVKFFTVKDAKTKDVIAAFYLDPYSRPENKNGE